MRPAGRWWVGVLVLGLVGCPQGDDDDDSGPADPPGTITTNLGANCASNHGIDFSSGVAECGQCGANPNGPGTDMEFAPLNFTMSGQGTSCFGQANLEIASLGAISGLGAVSDVPAAGWVQSVAAEVGHGYVVRTREDEYARFYVVEWLLDTGGAVEGVQVKWQYPFGGSSPTPTPTPTPVNAITVDWTAGSSVPGCEETSDGCLDPQFAVIDVDGTVTWDNVDSASHNVTSGDPSNGADGTFDSDLVSAGNQFVFQFDTPGTYPYFCVVHPWTTGTIDVVP